MDVYDRKRAKLFAIGKELRENHLSGACGRRGCDCLKKYERTRAQYNKLLDPEEFDVPSADPRRRGRG
ncbi:hypothetical protein [Microbacterium sp. KR10-403]|uniref:hypothetical protein n=1 Tax=Microbacterium sp. KR10-403 TaxID=3158581 RepID=UPI0032E47CF0